MRYREIVEIQRDGRDVERWKRYRKMEDIKRVGRDKQRWERDKERWKR